MFFFIFVVIYKVHSNRAKYKSKNMLQTNRKCTKQIWTIWMLSIEIELKSNFNFSYQKQMFDRESLVYYLFVCLFDFLFINQEEIKWFKRSALIIYGKQWQARLLHESIETKQRKLFNSLSLNFNSRCIESNRRELKLCSVPFFAWFPWFRMIAEWNQLNKGGLSKVRSFSPRELFSFNSN